MPDLSPALLLALKNGSDAVQLLCLALLGRSIGGPPCGIKNPSGFGGVFSFDVETVVVDDSSAREIIISDHVGVAFKVMSNLRASP